MFSCIYFLFLSISSYNYHYKLERKNDIGSNLKSKILELIAGRFPEVFIGLPPKVIVAIAFVLIER